MVTGSGALTMSTPVVSDAVLVERIAALGDRAALAELDARHGMTLYAIAYTLLLNPDAADVTVAATLRDAWRRAASFNAREHTVGRWLAALTRKTAQDQLRRSVMSPGGPPTRHTNVASPRGPAREPHGHRTQAPLRLAWAAAALVLPLILLT
jgi:DNA-directed RNA polymerase specialized sigma24 family protein